MAEFWQQLVEAHDEVLSAFGFNSTTDLLDRVTSTMSATASDGTGVLDGVKGFVAAVEWSDPAFTYLLVFHVVIWLLALCVCWRDSTRTMGMMALLLALVALSSTLNDLGKEHYMKIFSSTATSAAAVDPLFKKVIEDNAGGRKIVFDAAHGGPINYFDKNGVFVSAVYSAPLLLLAFVLQLRLMFLMVVMMVRVKRVQLRNEGSAARKAQGGDTQTNKKDQ
jgi:hypothetical protein